MSSKLLLIAMEYITCISVFFDFYTHTVVATMSYKLFIIAMECMLFTFVC